ncbi:hypothetical protein M419DRAFT_122184 [Trichoderma reesei RUT C-30]|uniref:Uncharacterized protein n=1 Tax=Hypocrea jecorina (strain ATCC 56765 / BCRC 32924 / NRRL 11460 / Rut C-30) TaxID=1344414 RepID=A0A024SIS8_HYPJR|nr:hypothetical protein M419DRAFT_122184 [Trichoderma reesei RUT C-30]
MLFSNSNRLGKGRTTGMVSKPMESQKTKNQDEEERKKTTIMESRALTPSTPKTPLSPNLPLLPRGLSYKASWQLGPRFSSCSKHAMMQVRTRDL